MEKRIFSSRTRQSAVRDAKLIVIATEGQLTEKKYFEDLATWHRNPKVHVEVLDRLDGNSSPDHMVFQLDAFQRTYHLNRRDELWVVVDVDRWGDAKLSLVSSICTQKTYRLAVSNPCFELWLLLHFLDVENCSAEEREALQANQKVSRDRRYIEQQLVSHAGSYNKSNLDTSPYFPCVKFAIEQARSLDTQKYYRWPHSLGTRVYKVVESIFGGMF